MADDPRPLRNANQVMRDALDAEATALLTECTADQQAGWKTRYPRWPNSMGIDEMRSAFTALLMLVSRNRVPAPKDTP